MSSNKLNKLSLDKTWILLGHNGNVTHVQEYNHFEKYALDELSTEDLIFLINEFKSFFDCMPEHLKTSELILINKLK